MYSSMVNHACTNRTCVYPSNGTSFSTWACWYFWITSRPSEKRFEQKKRFLRKRSKSCFKFSVHLNTWKCISLGLEIEMRFSFVLLLCNNVFVGIKTYRFSIESWRRFNIVRCLYIRETYFLNVNRSFTFHFHIYSCTSISYKNIPIFY